MTIGERIRNERTAQNISRQRLAEQVGLKYSTLSGLEAGDQKGTTQLHRIAAALGVTARWLETGQQPKYGVQEPQAEYQSQPARPDFSIIGASVQVLKEYLEIREEPAEWISDPVLLEIAYTVVEEFGEPPVPSNLLDLTKRFAERMRKHGARSVEAERTGAASGSKDRRSA